MTREERRVICPKCRKSGSLHLKRARGVKGVGYYWCVCHYLGVIDGKEKRKWCYVHQYEKQLFEEYLDLCSLKISRLQSRAEHPSASSWNYPKSVRKRIHRMWIRALKVGAKRWEEEKKREKKFMKHLKRKKRRK